MAGWQRREPPIEFEQRLIPKGHRIHYFVRGVIIGTVLGEVICLVHFGVVARDWAAAYALAATWIKDNVRKWFLE
jgi:hypothetical protein